MLFLNPVQARASKPRRSSQDMWKLHSKDSMYLPDHQRRFNCTGMVDTKNGIILGVQPILGTTDPERAGMPVWRGKSTDQVRRRVPMPRLAAVLPAGPASQVFVALRSFGCPQDRLTGAMPSFLQAACRHAKTGLS